MQDAQALGAQIRQHRRARKMTQQQLADAAGLSLRMIQDTEAGKHKPQPQNLVALRSALEIEGDAKQTEDDFPPDVKTFLYVIGAFLSSMPERDRGEMIREITTHIVRR
jgi:transcriptional regulator with XRE-family HTH domain